MHWLKEWLFTGAMCLAFCGAAIGCIKVCESMWIDASGQPIGNGVRATMPAFDDDGKATTDDVGSVRP